MEAFPRRRKRAIMDSSNESSSYASSSEPRRDRPFPLAALLPIVAPLCPCQRLHHLLNGHRLPPTMIIPAVRRLRLKVALPVTPNRIASRKERMFGDWIHQVETPPWSLSMAMVQIARGIQSAVLCEFWHISSGSFRPGIEIILGAPTVCFALLKIQSKIHKEVQRRSKKKFTGQGTVAPVQLPTSQRGQQSHLPIKKILYSRTGLGRYFKRIFVPERIKKPEKRWFPFVPVKDTASLNSAQVSVSQFSARDTQLSLMHEQSIITLMFESGLRKSSTATYGLDDDNVTLRQSLLTFLYRPGNVFNANVPEAFLIISICKKPSVLKPSVLKPSVVEYHPKCLRMFLNDRMVHTKIPDGQAPYPVVPLEIPVSALETVNELLISWTESTPEDLSMDYCVHVYLAKRKQLSFIIAGMKSNVLSVTKSSMQKRTRNGMDQDVVAGTRTLSLNCPVAKKRIVLPVRGIQCRHLECFDAFSFLSLNIGATARFLCPLCAQIVLPRDILVDEFFMEILSFAFEERIELVRDRPAITVHEHVKETTVANVKKGPAVIITIDDNNDGRVISID